MTYKQREQLASDVSKMFADATDAAVNGCCLDAEVIFYDALKHLISELSPEE